MDREPRNPGARLRLPNKESRRMSPHVVNLDIIDLYHWDAQVRVTVVFN